MTDSSPFLHRREKPSVLVDVTSVSARKRRDAHDKRQALFTLEKLRYRDDVRSGRFARWVPVMPFCRRHYIAVMWMTAMAYVSAYASCSMFR